ncbi:unnamed protein product [Bursaphelenchus xylophilus]|uniref:(pine wood nematode) hypothetical protein n=1 Tax=Bursaphelenchus xylophilus TaxID=6326 RepID=A0A1I7S8E4_BURXY|nr:unnamed protein product [Bursaphelenchus xylophilus]CAG9121012.1 unnamed protein product [Bursaphelenchus xylophilus]
MNYEMAITAEQELYDKVNEQMELTKTINDLEDMKTEISEQLRLVHVALNKLYGGNANTKQPSTTKEKSNYTEPECRPDVVSNLTLPYFGIGSSTELHNITMAVHRPTRELYRSLLLKKPKRRPILYQGMTLQGIMDDNMTSFGIQEFNAEYSPTAGTLLMEFYVKPRREFVSSTTTVQDIDNLRPVMVWAFLLKIMELGLADQDHGLRAVLNKFQKVDEEGRKIHLIPRNSRILRSVYNDQFTIIRYSRPCGTTRHRRLRLPTRNNWN